MRGQGFGVVVRRHPGMPASSALSILAAAGMDELLGPCRPGGRPGPSVRLRFQAGKATPTGGIGIVKQCMEDICLSVPFKAFFK